jgi:hypothetical protein
MKLNLPYKINYIYEGALQGTRETQWLLFERCNEKAQPLELVGWSESLGASFQ